MQFLCIFIGHDGFVISSHNTENTLVVVLGRYSTGISLSAKEFGVSKNVPLHGGGRTHGVRGFIACTDVLG